MAKSQHPDGLDADQMGQVDMDFDALLKENLGAFDPFDAHDNQGMSQMASQMVSQEVLRQRIKADIRQYERRQFFLKTACFVLAGAITITVLPWEGVWQSLMGTKVSLSVLTAVCCASVGFQLRALFSTE